MRFIALGALWLWTAMVASTVQGAESQLSEGSQELHESMEAGMQKMHSMKMTGNTDADFAAMMIEHHRQAIAMSRAAVEHGSSAEVKAKAQEIIAVSEKDISDLEKLKGQTPR